MFFFNKKIGFYSNYYTILFSSYISPYSNNIDSLYKNKKKAIFSCVFIYPILYKKIFFLELSSNIIGKHNAKKASNLNQTVILEGSISSHKCVFTVPLFSFLNNIFID